MEAMRAPNDSKQQAVASRSWSGSQESGHSRGGTPANDGFVGLDQPNNQIDHAFGAFLSSESTSNLKNTPAMAHLGRGEPLSVPDVPNAHRNKSNLCEGYEIASMDDEIPYLMLDPPSFNTDRHGFDLHFALDQSQIQQYHQQSQGNQGGHAVIEDVGQPSLAEDYQQNHLFERYRREQERGQHHAQQLGVTDTVEIDQSSTTFHRDPSRELAPRFYSFASVTSSGHGHWPQTSRSLSAPLRRSSLARTLDMRSPTPVASAVFSACMNHTTRADGISGLSSSLSGREANSRTPNHDLAYSTPPKPLKNNVSNPLPTPASSPLPMMVSYEQQDFAFDLNRINLDSRSIYLAQPW
jgi:hypothetical protein